MTGDVTILPVVSIDRAPQSRPEDLPAGVSDIGAARVKRVDARRRRRGRKSLLADETRE
jgi:hypothetical protein